MTTHKRESGIALFHRAREMRSFFLISVISAFLVPSPVRALAPASFQPAFGIPGLWLTIRGRDVNATGVQAEIGGLPARIAPVLYVNGQVHPTVAYVQVPVNAHTGPLTLQLPNQSPVSLGTVLITPVVTGHLVLPSSMNPRAYVVTTPFGYSAVASDGTFKVPVLEKGETWLYAYSSDPDVPLQTLSTGSDQSPFISMLTTAASLTLMHPELLTPSPDAAQAEWNAALGLPEVSALSDALEKAYVGHDADPLDSDSGLQLVSQAADAVLGALPTAAVHDPNQPTGTANGSSPLQSAPSNDLRSHMQYVKVTFVDTKASDDAKPVPRLEGASAAQDLPVLGATTWNPVNWIVDVKELNVRAGDVKGHGRDWVDLETDQNATFDSTTKQTVGTMMVYASTLSRYVDVLGTAISAATGALWEQKNNYVRIPPDHPGIYLVRAYGGLGSLPGAPASSEWKLIGGIPDGKRKLAAAVATDAVDIVMGIIDQIPVAPGDPSKVKFIKNAIPGYDRFQILPGSRNWKQIVASATANLTQQIALQIASTSQGTPIDTSKIWSLIVATAVDILKQEAGFQTQKSLTQAQADLEHAGYQNWAWDLEDLSSLDPRSLPPGLPVTPDRRLDRFINAQAAQKTISRFSKLLGKLNTLAKAAAAGSLTERFVGLIGAPPLETAILFYKNPLSPQIVSINPSPPDDGGSVTLTGSYLNPVYFNTKIDFRKPGASSGTPVTNLLPATVSPGQPDKIAFNLPQGIRGPGVLHIEGPDGSTDSYPLKPNLAPVLTGFEPKSASPGAVINLYGEHLIGSPTITVGTSLTPASIINQGQYGTYITFNLPLDATSGSIKLTLGNWPRVVSSDKMTVVTTATDPRIPPRLPTGSIIVNSRSGDSSGGPRAITLAQALELASGQINAASLAQRPKDPSTGYPLDRTCQPYASELVSGVIGPGSLTTITLNETPNYCDSSQPPPDSELTQPYVWTGDLSLPSRIQVLFSVPFDLRNGNLIAKDDDSFQPSTLSDGRDPLTIEDGGIILLGDRIVINSAKVKDSSGAGVEFSGARYAKISQIEVTNAAKDGVAFDEPALGSDGGAAHPADSNAIGALTVSGAKGYAVRFSDGSVKNTVGVAKITGGPGGSGILFASPSSGNQIEIQELSGVSNGPALSIQNSPGNAVTYAIDSQGNQTGYLYGNQGAAIQISGADSEGNSIGPFKIGRSPQGADASTGNGSGIVLQGGAHHNTIQPGEIIFSKGDAIRIQDAGTDDNAIIGSGNLYENLGDGISLEGGASFNTVDGQNAYQNQTGIHLSKAEGSVINQCDIFDNSGAGILLDQGSTDNLLKGNGIFGNSGDGADFLDPGTSGNWMLENVIGAASRNVSVSLPAGIDPNKGNAKNGVALMNGATENFVGSMLPASEYGSGDFTDYIYGNGLNGVLISGAGTALNHVTSAHIGIDPNDKPAPNGASGVTISGGAQNNALGWDWEWDPSPQASHFYSFYNSGMIPILLNNVQAGITLTDPNTTGNRFIAGEAGNSPYGLRIVNGASGNQVGVYHPNLSGSASDPRPPTVDFVGGSTAGIDVETPGNLIMNVQSNNTGYFGTGAGNATGIIIGDSADDTEISRSNFYASPNDAIRISSPNNWVYQNEIGPENQSAAYVGPGNVNGIRLTGAAQNNLLGILNSTGYSYGQGYSDYFVSNRVSGNSGDGLIIEGANAGSNVISNSIFGADDGLRTLSNQRDIFINDSPGNVIGGEFGDLSLNYILGSVNAGVLIQGANAVGNEIGGDAIGGKNAPNGIGVEVDGAPDTKIGGDIDDSQEGYDEYPNAFFYNSGDAIKVTGDGPTGATILSNEMGGNGGMAIDRSDGTAIAGPQITILSPNLLQIDLDEGTYPDGALLQTFYHGVTGEAPNGSQYPADHTVLAATESIDQPGTSLVVLPDSVFAPTGATFVSVLTDPVHGGSTELSDPVSPSTAFSAPASLSVSSSPGFTGGTAAPNQAGVPVLALDLKATGNLYLTGLTLTASGAGNEASSVSRIRIGWAETGTFALDPNQDPLADYPGFARDDGALSLTGLKARLSDGQTARLLVLYDFTANPADGTYQLSLADSDSVTGTSAENMKSAVVVGSFSISGPPITASGGSSVPTYSLGDPNGDGKSNVQDVILILQVVTHKITLTPAQKTAADVNKDGLVNVLDATLLLQRIVGIAKPNP